jgi:hypothetical protein
MEQPKDLMLRGQKAQSLTTSLKTGNYAAAIEALQSTISKAVSESIPVRQLINSGAKESDLVAMLAILLTKYASMLSVGGNLRAGHEVEIAKMLIDEYPLNSLDDFNVMLSRGIRGRYGEIFRFDVAVIFAWALAYQDEWAEEKEKQLNKPAEKTEVKSKEWSEETTKLVNEFQEKILEGKVKGVPKLSEKEIKEEGKERVKIKGSAYIPDPVNVLINQKKLQAARSRGLDKLELNQIKSFHVEGQTIVARNYEEALEIYTEVYL